jgi:chromosome segregation ATPase
MAASQTVLEILIQAVDESSAALAGTEANLKQVGQEAIASGTQLAVAGAAITGAYVAVVDAAANVQESQDNLKQAVTDAMGAVSGATGAYSTQVAFLQAKIDGYKASIAEATATLDTNTGSTQKTAAAHEKAAADIAADQANLAKYQAQLELLKNAEDLAGGSVSDITAKLNASADASVSLGFSVADSTASLAQAFTATKNVSEPLQVNQAAMDLARAKQIDLGTATNQVILAMNGQGARNLRNPDKGRFVGHGCAGGRSGGSKRPSTGLCRYVEWQPRGSHAEFQ